jgi:anion-transporting  ArsA/GET3 family ATPase
MSLESPGLADRRLVFVTGKGGTGKTTVSVALALALSDRGRRVLVAELGRDAQAPQLVEREPAPVGSTPRALAPGVDIMRIDPFDALEEYLRLQGWAGSWLARGLRQRGLHDLLVGTPGWRELITLGKLWYMAQDPESGGPPMQPYDHIIVDAPATGHGLTLLDVPRVVHSAVRSGPLARNAARVEAMLLDPAQTVLLPVCWPETLPVRETVELVERLESGVGIHVDYLVVNGVATPSPADTWPDLADRLDGLRTGSREDDAGSGVPPALLAACVRWSQARSRSQRAALDLLEQDLARPFVRLPNWPAGTLDEGRPDIDRLRSLGAALLGDAYRSAGT